MSSLNILVVEDNADHQFAAKEMLKAHNVHIAENAHDAAEMLAGGKYRRYEGMTREVLARRYLGRLAGTGYIIEKQTFDVVLTDAKLPIALGPYSNLSDPLAYEGKTFEFGYQLALLAAREQVPYIGMLSDTNSHDDPMSTLYNYLLEKETGEGDHKRYERVQFNINNSKLLFSKDAKMICLDNEFVTVGGSRSWSEQGVRRSEATYYKLDGTKFTGDYFFDLAEQGSERVAARNGQVILYKNWAGLLEELVLKR